MAPRKKPAVAAVEESVEALVVEESAEESVDAPLVPLAGTPVETPEGLHAEIGVPNPAFEAPTSDAGVDPVVARGPLEPTPALTVVHDMSVGSKRPEDGA